MTRDEMAAFKRLVTGEASYADRVSLGFALRLAIFRQQTGNDHDVLFEIQHLEQGTATTTKPAAQFKHAPLWPFWHKHFFSSQHLLRNIGERWNIARGSGNNDLDAMIRQVVAKHGHYPEMWQKVVTHQFIIGALEERSAANRITGNWIIFAKHKGQNYYLDLAVHEEGSKGENAVRLMKKLKLGSAVDFPFLFDDKRPPRTPP